MDGNYTGTCFPSPFSVYEQINVYNLGFPAQFLITKWWADYPTLQTILYVFAGIQMYLALLGVFMAIGRTVDPKEGLPTFVNRKIIVFFHSTWQLALSGLIIFLPTQWLSNITMGMILYHSWSEFFALVLRFMIVNKTLNKESYELFWKWVIIAVFFSAVPFMLGFNPYLQGFISVVFVVPADFLNLFVAPYLSVLWVKDHPHLSTAEKTSEVLIGVMNVLHVFFFYGQGIIACIVTVERGAQYFIVFQVISTFVFMGVITSYAYTIRTHREWEGPLSRIAALFACCRKGYGKSEDV